MAEFRVSTVSQTLVARMCIALSSHTNGLPLSLCITGSKIPISYFEWAAAQPFYSIWIRMNSSSLHRKIFTHLDSKMQAMTSHGIFLRAELSQSINLISSYIILTSSSSAPVFSANVPLKARQLPTNKM